MLEQQAGGPWEASEAVGTPGGHRRLWGPGGVIGGCGGTPRRESSGGCRGPWGSLEAAGSWWGVMWKLPGSRGVICRLQRSQGVIRGCRDPGVSHLEATGVLGDHPEAAGGSPGVIRDGLRLVAPQNCVRMPPNPRYPHSRRPLAGRVWTWPLDLTPTSRPRFLDPRPRGGEGRVGTAWAAAGCCWAPRRAGPEPLRGPHMDFRGRALHGDRGTLLLPGDGGASRFGPTEAA